MTSIDRAPGVRLTLVSVLFAGLVSSASAETKMWVTADAVNRRTCPSEECGVVGKLFFREAAVVYEMSEGWGRISDRYDASCAAGRSKYVDSGNTACLESNGIKDGRFAEWVSMQSAGAAKQMPGE